MTVILGLIGGLIAMGVFIFTAQLCLMILWSCVKSVVDFNIIEWITLIIVVWTQPDHMVVTFIMMVDLLCNLVNGKLAKAGLVILSFAIYANVVALRSWRF